MFLFVDYIGKVFDSLAVRILETFIMIFYVRFVDDRLHIRFKDMLRSNLVLLKDFFRYGLSGYFRRYIPGH